VIDPRPVLREYALPREGLTIQAVPGGFSGALVWKVNTPEGKFALKAWPKGQPAYLPLPQIHQRMQELREAEQLFVPQVIINRKGSSVNSVGESRFDLVTWQPGEAESTASPSRIQAAIKAIGQVHAVWKRSSHQRGICFAAQHQFQRLTEWTATELETLQTQVRGLSAVYATALQIFLEQRERALRRLLPWLQRKVSLQFCLGDIWSDHVLFTGDQVSGIIDYGGMRLDHPAQDLARLLGSWCRGDTKLRQIGLETYQPASEELTELAVLLEATGAMVGIGNWMRWLVLEKKPFADIGRAERRLGVFVEMGGGPSGSLPLMREG
jgi:aminoglycoside phosphotransferase (APT) family kinase protein